MGKAAEAIKVLIDQYEKLEQDIPAERMMEKLACGIYLKVFDLCLRRARKDKHEKFMHDEFYNADRRRLDLSGDHSEDACVEALKQEAYRQAWEATGLTPGRLVKAKHRMFSADGPGYSALYSDKGKMLYAGAVTGRFPSMGGR